MCASICVAFTKEQEEVKFNTPYIISTFLESAPDTNLDRPLEAAKLPMRLQARRLGPVTDNNSVRIWPSCPLRLKQKQKRIRKNGISNSCPVLVCPPGLLSVLSYQGPTPQSGVFSSCLVAVILSRTGQKSLIRCWRTSEWQVGLNKPSEPSAIDSCCLTETQTAACLSVWLSTRYTNYRSSLPPACVFVAKQYSFSFNKH